MNDTLEFGTGDERLRARFEPFRRSTERVLWIGRPGPPGWRDLADRRLLTFVAVVGGGGVLVWLLVSSHLGFSFSIAFPLIWIGGGFAAIYELVTRWRAIYAVTDQRVLTLTSSIRAVRGLHLTELDLRHIAHVSPSRTGPRAALNVGATLDAPRPAAAKKEKPEVEKKPRIVMLALPDAAAVARLIEQAQLAEQARRRAQGH